MTNVTMTPVDTRDHMCNYLCMKASGIVISESDIEVKSDELSIAELNQLLEQLSVDGGEVAFSLAHDESNLRCVWNVMRGEDSRKLSGKLMWSANFLRTEEGRRCCTANGGTPEVEIELYTTLAIEALRLENQVR